MTEYDEDVVERIVSAAIAKHKAWILSRVLVPLVFVLAVQALALLLLALTK